MTNAEPFMLIWLLVTLLLIAPYPLALRLTPRDRLLALTVTPGLALLAITVPAFLAGWLGGALQLPIILIIYTGVMLFLWVTWIMQHRAIPLPTSPHTRVEWFALALIGVIALAVLFNAAYFPFYRPDALGIYTPFAAQMYESGQLVPLKGADTLYEAYPMAIPLLYTSVYQLAGWEHEYAAKFADAVLSLLTIPAAYIFARDVGGRRAGWIAALLLALMPTVSRWASSGYVDLPMAYFYTLTAVFALRLWRNGQLSDAILLGAMLGGAAWTKNAALIGVPLITLLLIAALIRRRASLIAVMMSGAVALVTGGLFYVRNFIEAGLILPDTAWVDQTQPTLENLLVLITKPQNYALSGWLIMIGLLLAAVMLVRSRAVGLGIGFWLAMPLFAAWWLFVSYDPRFVLLFLPIWCALTAVPLSHVHVPQRLMPVIAVALIALTLYGAFLAVEYKDEILRSPLMTHDDKIALTRP